MPGGTVSAHHGRRVSPDVISRGSCALEEVWDKTLNLAGPQKKTEKSMLVQLTCFRAVFSLRASEHPMFGISLSALIL